VRRNLAVLAGSVVLALAAAGAVTWLVTRGPAPPVVDQAQARAMTPAIDSYLARQATSLGGGLLMQAARRLKPRVFCDEVIIEIRPDGPARWKVGMQIDCDELARRGNELVEGTAGDIGAGDIMTLVRSGTGFRAVSLVTGQDFYDPGWVDRHFSPGAAAEINGENSPEPGDPYRQAWRAFGFPRGTRPHDY
jgi:hypothetical protein